MRKYQIIPLFARMGEIRSLTCSYRAYSGDSNWKKINAKINRIGDENSQESKKVLSILRKTGGASIIAVICLLLWMSTFVDVPEKEEFEVGDLSKDVRDS